MEISHNTSRQHFTSFINPIKPFILNTSEGKLFVREPGLREIKKSGFVDNLTDLFVRNIAENTDDPTWQLFLDKSDSTSNTFFKAFSDYLKEKLYALDGDLTLLAAFDNKNKLQGACMSYGLDDVPFCKDRVCYIESISVNDKYKGLGVGRALVEKTLESAKNAFTDVFLAGEHAAAGFYKKLGFKNLEVTDKAQRNAIDFIALSRDDYPQYVSLLTKPLQEEKPRWYDAIFELLENINKHYSQE